jgi:hypothetical protein
MTQQKGASDFAFVSIMEGYENGNRLSIFVRLGGVIFLMRIIVGFPYDLIFALLIIFGFVVIVTLVVLQSIFSFYYHFLRDRDAIDRDIESRGGKLISKTNIIGIAPLPNYYLVRYLDSSGQEHKASCGLDFFSQVSWGKDEIIIDPTVKHNPNIFT